jgi:hypothetical protein
MHTLSRARFYECVAKDLGVTGQVIDLGHGIWELGRKRLPGRDSSKVIFIEAGVPTAVLELTLMRDPFMTLCLLHHGKPPMHDWHSDKTLFRGVIEVRDGRYASDVLEDLSASQRESSSATRIELEELPPKLWICGEEFNLPISPEGIPTDRCRYLAYLFNHGDKPITCWDLYFALRPEEKEKIGGPGWSDEIIDEQGKLDFKNNCKRRRLNSVKPSWTHPCQPMSWNKHAIKSMSFKSKELNFSARPVEAARLSKVTEARQGSGCARH